MPVSYLTHTHQKKNPQNEYMEATHTANNIYGLRSATGPTSSSHSHQIKILHTNS